MTEPFRSPSTLAPPQRPQPPKEEKFNIDSSRSNSTLEKRAMAAASAPVLSTPAEHVFEDSSPARVPVRDQSQLSEEQLWVQYEIKRTIDEIRAGAWRRVALQFADEMLVDAPRVFERLRDGLKLDQRHRHPAPDSIDAGSVAEDVQHPGADAVSPGAANGAQGGVDDKLCILADTSYGACCVDEVAAQHVDADVVVHYGRACLSPTARLPVIYVFTSKDLDMDAVVASFEKTYPDKLDKVCIMADIPYAHHIPDLHRRLLESGYINVFPTEIKHSPSSPLPNRTVPEEVAESPGLLGEYSIFHLSTPPTSLLLILSSRVKRINIFPTDAQTPIALEASTAQLLRRRYATLTRLSTVPIFGILINTLSVSDYMSALQHCQDLISQAQKKSYVFVVGKVNAAKLANFSEIGGWVVIGCWESSLIESKDFYAPIITPFELEVALTEDRNRVWSGEWVGDFSQLLKTEGRPTAAVEAGEQLNPEPGVDSTDDEDDEPPEFDLRTGRYVSRPRPFRRKHTAATAAAATTSAEQSSDHLPKTFSSTLTTRSGADLMAINGTLSPGAEFLRTKRTWQGLGSDREIAYERDEDGKIRGAVMEEGRSGIARGYSVGEERRT